MNAEPERAELREHSRRNILEQIATGKNLPAILEAIVAIVEQESPESCCSILLLDKARRRLQHGAGPRLPTFYTEAVDGLEIGQGIGCCGTAAFIRERVVVEDISTHPYWADFRELASRAGLRSCWSEPIFSSSGETLGTFAIYHSVPCRPSPEALEAIALSVHLASIAIERAKTEEAVRASQRMLRLVLDNVPQGVFWKDRELRYLGCNQVVAKAFGFDSPKDIIGKRDEDFPGLVAEQIDGFSTRDRQVLEKGEPELGSAEKLTLADGRETWMEISRVPLLGAAGEVVGVLGTWQDLTARRRAEEERLVLERQVQHAQKLESLGVLAGGIAHDFNNLLTSILGYADLAMYELPQGSPTRALIGEAVRGARQAAELTKQMLAYSGKGHFVVEPLDLSSLVEDLARLLQISVSKKCVLKFELLPGLPAILADAAQMRQVVMNLVINASEAIGDRSGFIVVSTGATYCDRASLHQAYLGDELPEGLYVYVEVRDNGSGMSAETRARIFDPFFTTKFTGRGLGLAAVLGIVRGHHASIDCVSSLGQGTTFRVLLPASAKHARQLAGIESPAERWRGQGTVLVVDDEETIRSLARHMLRRMGFSVLTAVDGREAVEIYRAEGDKISMVLLDMTMPHLDGEETLRELQLLQPNVKVVLSSGFNEQTATSRFAGKGLAGFLQKPYRFEELQAIVRQAIGA